MKNDPLDKLINELLLIVGPDFQKRTAIYECLKRNIEEYSQMTSILKRMYDEFSENRIKEIHEHQN